MASIETLTSTARIQRNTVLHGDCLSILPTLPARSIRLHSHRPALHHPLSVTRRRKIPNDDNDRWLKPAFAEMFRVLANNSFSVSFYGWPQADKFIQAYRAAGFRVVGHFTFPKRYTSRSRFVRYQHECAHLLAKGNPACPEDTIGDVIDWTYSGNKLHPTQKPLLVLLPLVETFCPLGGTLLDPFSGSGSSLLAAKTLGRSYVGIELDANYHAIADSRLSTT